LTVVAVAFFHVLMCRVGAKNRFSARAIARLVACLFALQGLFLAAGPGAAERALAGVGWNIAAAGEYCAAQRDDAQPAHDQHESCRHCVFCADGERDVSFLIAAIFTKIVLATEDADVPPPPKACQEHDRRLIGWASSWSSCAPPTFS
jgi:hypothetical protein